MKLVLFDCDGTLVDSGRLIHEVMARTFVDFGFDRPTYESTKSIIGLTLDIAIARMLGRPRVDDEVHRMMLRYKEIYVPVRAEPGFQEPLYEGIGPMMAELAARDDVILGAVTGKSRRGLTHIAETHGFAPHFFVSRTADDCPSKPHPAMVLECCHEAGIDPENTIVIGDSLYDMVMAKSAGAKAIGVSWGYGAVADLSEGGADSLVDHPREIPPQI